MLEQLARKHAFLKSDNLLMGALDYILRRESEALDKLEAIKPATQPKSLGAQTAFMISVLLASSNHARAIELLDLARTLAPGTLLEESALRSEILLLVRSRSAEKSLRLLRQYLARFGRSLFAERFVQELVAIIPGAGLADSVDDVRKLEFFADAVSPEHRNALLLSIARNSLLNGRMDVVEATTSRVIETPDAGSPGVGVARMYRAAARLSSGGDESAVAELQKIDATKLPRSDQFLLAGAKEIAKRQRTDAGNSVVLADGPGATAFSAEEIARDLESRAEKAISRAVQLLEK